MPNRSRTRPRKSYPFVVEKWDDGCVVQLTNGKLATVWEAGWRRVGADRTRAVAEQVVESQLREHSTQFRIREV